MVFFSKTEEVIKKNTVIHSVPWRKRPCSRRSLVLHIEADVDNLIRVRSNFAFPPFRVSEVFERNATASWSRVALSEAFASERGIQQHLLVRVELLRSLVQIVVHIRAPASDAIATMSEMEYLDLAPGDPISQDGSISPFRYSEFSECPSPPFNSAGN